MQVLQEKLNKDLLWAFMPGHARDSQPARIYIHQIYANTGCCVGDMQRAMDDREAWLERVKRIHLISQTDDDDGI